MRAAQNGDAATHLSKRQLEVLQGIVDGLSLKEIGAQLSVSAKTIEYHYGVLRSILHIHQPAILVQFALKHRLSVPAILPNWPKTVTVTAIKTRCWLPFTSKPLGRLAPVG